MSVSATKSLQGQVNLYWSLPGAKSKEDPEPWFAPVFNAVWNYTPIPELMLLSRESRTNREIVLPSSLSKKYSSDNKLSCVSLEDANWMVKEVLEQECYGDSLLVDRDSKELVIDIGANIGVFGMWAAQKGHTVVCIEPVPVTFNALYANSKRITNGSMKCVMVGLKGPSKSENVENKEESLPFVCFEDVPSCSTAAPEDKHDANIAPLRDEKAFIKYYEEYRPKLCALINLIPSFLGLQSSAIRVILSYLWRYREASCKLTSVEDALDMAEIKLAKDEKSQDPNTFSSIHLLKIDVEGFELEVLKSVPDHLWPKVQNVVIEVHDFDGRCKEVQSILESQGLSVTVKEDEYYNNELGMNHFMIFAKRS